MNENDIIKNIQQLNAVNPTELQRARMKATILRAVTETVRSEPYSETPTHVPRVSPWSKYALAGCMTAFCALLIVHQQNLEAPPVAALAGKNAYEQSVAALTQLRADTEHFVKNAHTEETEHNLEHSMRVAQITLDTLGLMGEPGKYTEAQCRSAYESFDEQLDDIIDALEEREDARGLSPENKKRLDATMAVARATLKEVHQRLGSYRD